MIVLLLIRGNQELKMFHVKKHPYLAYFVNKKTFTSLPVVRGINLSNCGHIPGSFSSQTVSLPLPTLSADLHFVSQQTREFLTDFNLFVSSR